MPACVRVCVCVLGWVRWLAGHVSIKLKQATSWSSLGHERGGLSRSRPCGDAHKQATTSIHTITSTRTSVQVSSIFSKVWVDLYCGVWTASSPAALHEYLQAQPSSPRSCVCMLARVCSINAQPASHNPTAIVHTSHWHSAWNGLVDSGGAVAA